MSDSRRKFVPDNSGTLVCKSKLTNRPSFDRLSVEHRSCREGV